MNLEAIKDLAASKFARQALIAQKHSPKMLFVAGTVGVVSAAVLACRATLKVSEVLDELEQDIVKIDRKEAFSVEDRSKMKHKAQIRAAASIAKGYIPAAVIMAGSIAALTGSHIILTRRNTAVVAAYAAVQKSYDQYRERVRSELGLEKDNDFAVGAVTRKVEERMADGTTKVVEKKVVDETLGKSPYAACFDEKSKHFTREPGMNEHILEMKQSWANDKLKAKGHLFLNEVYDFLDLPRSKAGAVVGWVYDPKNADHKGDNYVSFGIFDNEPELVNDFFDGLYNQGIWLDFNVDGVILDLI